MPTFSDLARPIPPPPRDELTPTPEEVKAARDAYCVGLQEAYRIVLREKLIKAVDDVNDIDDLKRILRYVVRKM